MPLLYDSGSSYLDTCLRCSNTVVPSVLKRFEFWLLFAFHLMVNFAYRHGWLHGADDKRTMLFIEWNEMKVIGAITTFFEVFYTNQCFSRYLKLHTLTRTLLGTLYDYAFELRLHLIKDNPNHLRLACRCFLASILLFFYEMNSQVSESEWRELKRLGLLRDDEKQFLLSMDKHQRSHVMMQWSAEATKDTKMPANVMKSSVDKLLKARLLQQQVVDTINMPIPFQYFHLLRLMVVMNLLMWSYGMGITDSIFSPCVYFLAAFIFMGMMELAAQLSDPFGDDEVDFPVSDWLAEFLHNMAVICEFKSIGPMSERVKCEVPLSHGNLRLNLFMSENMSWDKGHQEIRKAGNDKGHWFIRANDESGDDDDDDDCDDD